VTVEALRFLHGKCAHRLLHLSREVLSLLGRILLEDVFVGGLENGRGIDLDKGCFEKLQSLVVSSRFDHIARR
jgi:hypothetical protein